MTYQKLLQQSIGVIMVIALIGCTAPAKPLVSPTPTQIPSVTSSPGSTATLVQISNFEECVESGKSIENTYPRQCISDNGEIFKEALDEGVVFGNVYGEEGHYEETVSITLTDDGGYLITGTEPDVRKFDASGEKEWEYNLGSEFGKEFPFANAIFGCGQTRQTSDGGYVIMAVGSTMHEGGGQEVIKFFTIKLDRDGQWVSEAPIAEKAGKVFYLDSDGNLVWLTSLGVEIGMPRKVIETLDGGYAMAGPLPQDHSGSNIHLVKTDANGVFVWEKNLCRDKNIQQTWEEKIVCSYNYVKDAIQSRDGGYVMTGGAGNGTWLIKMDTSGNIEWMHSYPQESPNTGDALLQLPDGGYLIAGAQVINEQHDGMLIKTDSAGNLQWSRTFGGDQADWFRMMKQSPNNEIIIMGWTESFGEGSHNTWLLGIDPTTIE